MKWYQTVTSKIVTLLAVLAVPVQGGLAAQNQPQPKQAQPTHTIATANYNFLIASGFL